LCGEHVRMDIGGGRVLYVHLIFLYSVVEKTTHIR
jgi:hypothetical protein